MKAHINLPSKVKKQIAEYVQKEEMVATRKIIKLFCVALNEDFAFGKVRLSQLIKKVMGLIEESKTDEIFWGHIDRYVIEQIGMPFEEEKEF